MGQKKGGFPEVIRRRPPRAAYPIRFARLFLSALNRVSCDASGSWATLAFLYPPRFPKAPAEQRTLSAATLSRVRGPQGDMAMWRWGSGPPVLLVHGWGGNAGRLTRFVPPLLDAGFGVVAFDAPAHGLSGGYFASLPDFVDAIERAAHLVSPIALVGHSMGAAACALALRRGLEARAAVLLSAPADPELYAVRFARYLRLSPAATEAMKRRLQDRYQVQLRDLWLGSGGPPVPTLVFHDERDARVPLREGLAIASSWPRAELVATRGLGHHRILRDPGVIERAVVFLRQTAGVPERARTPAAGRRSRPGRRPAPAGTVLEEIAGLRPN